MRPLFLEFPKETRLLREETAYFFGDFFLVAPIVQPDMLKREVYLPPGRWVNYWTGETYEGRQSVTLDAPIDRIPLLVKKGAIIPMQQVMQYTNEEPVDPLTLDIFPGYYSIFIRINRTSFFFSGGNVKKYGSSRFCTEINAENILYISHDCTP